MTPAKMFDGDLWVLASDVMQLAENAYKNGQTDEREACAQICLSIASNPTSMNTKSSLRCCEAIRSRGNT